jgi:hypothetical protein
LGTEREKLRSRLETEFELLSFETADVYGTYNEFMEMSIQYGFVVMFACAFPLSPFLAWINNIFGKIFNNV